MRRWARWRRGPGGGGEAPAARDREAPQLPGPHLLEDRGQGGEHHLDVAADEVDHRLLEEPDEALDRDAPARQVHQRVEDRLPGTVVRDVAPPVACDDRDAEIPFQSGGSALPQRVHRRMLDDPDLVGRGVGPSGGELAHRPQSFAIGHLARSLDDDVFDEGHSTMTTQGWSHSSWYSASSCSREVARTTHVMLR